MLFFIPLYWYGIHMNRMKEINNNMKFYEWNYIDKRNRLTHNMIMEHFEVHKEMLQDILLEMEKEGAKVFEDLPEPKRIEYQITQDELAFIDEMCGLSGLVEEYIKQNPMPAHTASKLRSHYIPYEGMKSKDEIRYEWSLRMSGGSR